MTPKAPNKPAELLNDLESIRALLGDDFPDTAATGAPVDPDSIPLLSDIVEPGPAIAAATPSDDEPRETSVRSAFRSLAERHIDHELRTAANLILQEVIDDFVPQIEAELKRRLAGDTARAATTGEVQDLRREARALKECVADLTLENRLLKKSMVADGGNDE